MEPEVAFLLLWRMAKGVDRDDAVARVSVEGNPEIGFEFGYEGWRWRVVSQEPGASPSAERWRYICEPLRPV